MFDRNLNSFARQRTRDEHNLAVIATGQSLTAGDKPLGQHGFNFTFNKLIGHVGSVGGIVSVPTHLPEGRS